MKKTCGHSIVLLHSWYHVGLGFDRALLSELKEFVSIDGTVVSMLGSERWYMGKRPPHQSSRTSWVWGNNLWVTVKESTNAVGVREKELIVQNHARMSHTMIEELQVMVAITH